MKKALVVVPFLTLFCMMFLVSSSPAQDKATKEECVVKVKEAAAMIKESGLDATLVKLNDPKGPFVWKDSYVFCYRLDGLMLGHPNAKLVGQNLIHLKDAEGRMHVVEFMNVAKTSGEGWVTYSWPKLGETAGSPKITYVYKVPGEDVALFAGVYE